MATSNKLRPSMAPQINSEFENGATYKEIAKRLVGEGYVNEAGGNLSAANISCLMRSQGYRRYSKTSTKFNGGKSTDNFKSEVLQLVNSNLPPTLIRKLITSL